MEKGLSKGSVGVTQGAAVVMGSKDGWAPEVKHLSSLPQFPL